MDATNTGINKNNKNKVTKKDKFMHISTVRNLLNHSDKWFTLLPYIFFVIFCPGCIQGFYDLRETFYTRQT